MKFILPLILCLIIVFQTQAQTTKWTVRLDSASVFSSPRFVDINQDDTLDIIYGGGNEAYYIENGIIALDGRNGEVIWTLPWHTQIYTSALQQDITGDGVNDLFFGGRDASFLAINAVTGKVIWKFWDKTTQEAKDAGYYNFYATQFLDDLNNDGINDILTSNGGDALIMPENKNRPRGKLIILSGKDGSIITESTLPINREIYYAPHTHTNHGKDSISILFGTGGETIDGSFYETSLTELMNGDISKSREIIKDKNKGFIVNSTLADLNTDGKLDFINSSIGGMLTVVNGSDRSTLWQKKYDGFEGYSVPVLGYFNDDDVADVFVNFGHGKFIQYDFFMQVVIDGATGKEIFRDTAGAFQFAPAITFDFNHDGTDEIMYLENYMNFETYASHNQLKVIDFKNDTMFYYGEQYNGGCFSSSPTLVDLENDGKHEIIRSYADNEKDNGEPFTIIECIQTDDFYSNITWGGYLGPNENGAIGERKTILEIPDEPLKRSLENHLIRYKKLKFILDREAGTILAYKKGKFKWEQNVKALMENEAENFELKYCDKELILYRTMGKKEAFYFDGKKGTIKFK